MKMSQELSTQYNIIKIPRSIETLLLSPDDAIIYIIEKNAPKQLE